MHDIIQRMKDVMNSETNQCDDEALEMIAKLADGGMRRFIYFRTMFGF